MKWKKRVSIETDNFWDDLFEGGHIHFDKVLSDPEEIKKLEDAKRLLLDFKKEGERNDIIQYF